jgi:hypothetical protein
MKKDLKAPHIGEVDVYKGGLETLNKFINQLENYFYFNNKHLPTNTDKVLYTSSHFNRSILQAFLPIKTEYHQNPENYDEETKEIFTSYLNFIKYL